MLDMGFLPDIRRVLAALPSARQNLMFSATMPPGIATLANQILTNPVKLAVTPAGSTVDQVAQRVLFVDRESKRALLGAILRDPAMTRVLVFTRTKHGANRVARDLAHQGVTVQAIHGNKSQNARNRALGAFKTGEIRVLVATDLAARGLDVSDVSHVINFELPSEPESYVHRIGRTARAGGAGTALSFCDADERAYLGSIQRLTRSPLEVVHDHPFARPAAPGLASSRAPLAPSHGTPRRGVGQLALPIDSSRCAARVGWRFFILPHESMTFYIDVGRFSRIFLGCPGSRPRSSRRAVPLAAVACGGGFDPKTSSHTRRCSRRWATRPGSKSSVCSPRPGTSSARARSRIK